MCSKNNLSGFGKSSIVGGVMIKCGREGRSVTLGDTLSGTGVGVAIVVVVVVVVDTVVGGTVVGVGVVVVVVVVVGVGVVVVSVVDDGGDGGTV